MTISRRDFLKTAAGAGMAACLGPLVSAGISEANKRGVREFRFKATESQINLGGNSNFKALTYNGQTPGPEIRVKEGETIRVILENDLSEATTIHWHGIPLQNQMDGVPGLTQKPVKPGQNFTYEFEASPAGSFLYHSHAKYQLDQGLYGPLIIEEERPDVAYDREYTLTLEDWVTRDGGGTARTLRRPPMAHMHGRMQQRPSYGPSEGPLWEPLYDEYAVNGLVAEALKPLVVSKGDRIRLRLINASSATIYYLRLAGHSLSITHTDGNAIKPVETDVLRIGMGERYDVMFVADNPGHWLMAAYDTGLDEGKLKIPIQYRGSRQKKPQPPTFERGLRMAEYSDFESREATGFKTRRPDRFYDQVLGGGMRESYWSINGQIWPLTDDLIVLEKERVRLRYGNHSMMPHPMHLHGHFFRVVNPNLPAERWVAKDTIILDHMQRIDVDFDADNPGRWLHHCHNLYHMEAGMANVLAYDLRSYSF